MSNAQTGFPRLSRSAILLGRRRSKLHAKMFLEYMNGINIPAEPTATKHTARFLAADFRFLDFEVTRQDCTDLSQSDQITGLVILGTTNHLLSQATRFDFADSKTVCVGVLLNISKPGNIQGMFQQPA